MKDIKCPSCGKTFQIDPSSFDELISQIRNEEFNNQVNERLKLAEEEKLKEIEITKKELLLEMSNKKNELEKNIIALKSQIVNAGKDKTNAMNEIRNESEMKINNLNSKIEKLNNEIISKAEIEKLSREKEVNEAINKIEKEKTKLIFSLEKMKQDKALSEKNLQERFQEIIKERDLKILDLRDMQLKLSTKMQGETLERHCENEFNRLRSTGFQNSIFEKDNDISTGSKGDYIFREFDSNNIEVISIMFEMKNESSLTNNKRRK